MTTEPVEPRPTDALTADLLPSRLEIAGKITGSYLPIVVAVGIFYDWDFMSDSDPMFLSVIATASVLAWLIMSSLTSTATTLSRLQHRGALPLRTADVEPEATSTDGEAALPVPSDPIASARIYLAHPRWKWITLGVALATAAGMYLMMWSEAHYRTGSANPNWLPAMAREFDWSSTLVVLTWVPAAGVIGALFVRFVMMVRVMTLAANHWKLRPLVGHPDKAAGLKPLGDQLIRGFVISSAPAILVAVWVILLSRDDLGDEMQDLSERWLDIFRFGLAPVLTLVAIAFAFYPLRHVRHLILEANLVLYAEVDRLARTIHEQATESIARDTIDGLVEGKAKVDALRGLYSALFPLPQWPFDRVGILKIVSAVTPQILGFTGLGSSIIDLIGSALDSVQ